MSFRRTPIVSMNLRFLIFPVLVSLFAAAQEPRPAVAAAGLEQPISVPFLAREPVVDGRLDPGLERLPVHRLRAYREDTTLPDAAPVLARLAYGTRFLYLHVESSQAALACRDRAYQNGDGLILALATPEAGGQPSRRFRVLAFSPQEPAARNWQHVFTWYRDVDLVMSPLEQASFAWHSDGKRVSFELLLPWAELGPYHPLAGISPGLNLCYVRAVGKLDKEEHYLRFDDHIQEEQHPRSYLPARFETPAEPASLQVFAQLERGHLCEGEAVKLRLAALGPQEVGKEFVVRVFRGEGEPLARRRLAWPGTRYATLTLDDLRLPPGGYQLEATLPGGPPFRWGLSVLPAKTPESLAKELDELAPRLAPGTLATLAFRLQDALAEAARLQPGDTAGALRVALEALDRDLAVVRTGRDPIAESKGLLRRAYRSKVDQTLQPYSLRVPEKLEPGKRYPMLVFLHGSGQDDQGVLNRPRAPEGWFQLAPKGRGTSNCYSADHAQDDLRESLDDALAQYPVDPQRVLLAGFSMGGYGVYRTAFERPGFFKGLVVFSGVPDVATRWLGEGHPDFLDPRNLTVFKGAEMLVFHGTADRNCPYEKTAHLVELLKTAGARVEFVAEEGKGHESPNDANLARILAWMQGVAGNTH